MIITDGIDSKLWKAGTLTYNRRQLSWLIFWLLFGDFAAMLEATALPLILPLHLKNLQFSASQIGSFMALGYLVGMVVVPIAGMWSDRLRSRWGRRRPFILFTMPLNACGMIAIPFIHNIWLLGIAVTLVNFSISVSTIKYFLFNDVVPGEIMGRFLGAFRLVGLLGALFFQLVLFRIFDSHPAMVWIIVGTVGAVCNIIMLLMVREGEYPAPGPKQPLLTSVRTFIAEGLGSRFMWMLWLTLGMTALASPAAAFANIFYKDGLGMSSISLGWLAGLGTGIAMALAMPCGWLIDRVGPRRIWGICGILVGVTQIVMFFCVVDIASAFILNVVSGSIGALMGMACLPMTFAHLPKEKFGQLTGCQSLVNQGLFFLGSVAAGNLIKLCGDNYRVVFLYSGTAYLLSTLFLILLTCSRNPFAGMTTSMNADGNRKTGVTTATDSGVDKENKIEQAVI